MPEALTVLMISPGFPGEMPFFTRGLAEVGSRAVGLGDQPEAMLPEMARRHLSAFLEVPSLWDEGDVLERVRRLADRMRIDRVECLWEPAMILAARLREGLGLPGMTVAETIPFRDKGRMKEVLDAAGIRTPRHVRAGTEDQIREAVERVGYPAIVKPIAGAGSADTYRLDGVADLERVLPLLRYVGEMSVEEFIDGEEYTFDTVCAGGEILFHNIAWYRPRPLIARTVEWISPQTVTLRRVDAPHLEAGRRMGHEVLAALGFRTGFTHMEWFLKPDGEAVFGEIGARPPGARSVELMNYSCDFDVFTGWAEAVCHRRLTQSIDRRYNAAIVFKRAHGSGNIQGIEGLDRLLRTYGEQIVSVELLPPGSPRRNWHQTLLSDGWVIVRHPELRATLEIADRVGTELQIYAG